LHSFEWSNNNGWIFFEIPKEVWIKESFLNTIDKQFKISYVGILKVYPHRSYEWHVDDSRGLAINMLLSDNSKSHCYFGRESIESWDQYEIVECPYSKDSFYLFNTQCPHMILNLNEERYLVTVEFEVDKEHLKYNDVREWCIQNDLVENELLPYVFENRNF
jgi:hypothetical protein